MALFLLKINLKTFSFQTKYTLIDEQDIPLVENYAFEVNATSMFVCFFF